MRTAKKSFRCALLRLRRRAANEELRRLLADALGVARSDVSIVAGESSRHKKVAVPLTIEQVRRLLS